MLNGRLQMISKVAVIQYPPVLGNRLATIEKAVSLIDAAADEGAKLVVLPEAFIPGYPTYIWRLRPGGDMGLSSEIHALMLENAVNLDGSHLEPLRSIAKHKQIDILIGIHEIDNSQSRTSLFNTYVHIDIDGNYANVHRKLMPTNPERMVWGFGDGQGLRVIETPVGRVGALICWENYMPLARMALYSQGVEIYIAPTWDSSDGWQGSMQHIAREGRCYVVNCCTSMRGSDVPADFPGCKEIFASDEQINPGKSSIIAPSGSIIAGPLDSEVGILYADIDLAEVRNSRRSLDIAGHYNRPDIFNLQVNRQRQAAAVFKDDEIMKLHSD